MTEDDAPATRFDGFANRGTLAVVGAIVVAIAVVVLAGGFDAGVQGLAGDQPRTEVVGVSGNTTVTVEYTTAGGEYRKFVVEGVDPALSDSVDDWAFVDRSALPPELGAVAGDHTAGVVPVGGRVLVGNLSGATRQVGNATVTVVAPAGRDVDPERKAHFIAEFLSPYALGPERTEVTLVAAPDALPHNGLLYADNTGYVTIEAFWDGDVGSVWLHEVVHARQSFTLEPEMGWFREASAEYLSYRAMQEQYGPVTDSDVRARLEAAPTHSDATLANRSTWDGETVDYTRGVRLLYAVDAEIRTGSDGEHTIVDVFRTMNGREDPISVREFRRIVERYSGEDEAWIRAAITDSGSMDRYREYDGVFETG